jgi:CBS domain-containing protein
MVAVLDKLKASPARRVLVMRNGALAGIITASDIAFWLERARQETGIDRMMRERDVYRTERQQRTGASPKW